MTYGDSFGWKVPEGPLQESTLVPYRNNLTIESAHAFDPRSPHGHECKSFKVHYVLPPKQKRLWSCDN